MNIFCINVEEARLQNITFLDWLTGPTLNRGKNSERYWMIKTDTRFYPSDNKDAHILGQLLDACRTHNFSMLMLIKQQNGEQEDRNEGAGDVQTTEEPSNSEASGDIPDGSS